jgi:hypothetical protein
VRVGPSLEHCDGSSARPLPALGEVVVQARRKLRRNNVSAALVGRLLHNGVRLGQSPKVGLTEKPRFTVLEPHLARC